MLTSTSFVGAKKHKNNPLFSIFLHDLTYLACLACFACLTCLAWLVWLSGLVFLALRD